MLYTLQMKIRNNHWRWKRQHIPFKAKQGSNCDILPTCAQHTSEICLGPTSLCRGRDGSTDTDRGICKPSGNQAHHLHGAWITPMMQTEQIPMAAPTLRIVLTTPALTFQRPPASFSLKVLNCSQELQKTHICLLAQPKHHPMEFMRVMIIFRPFWYY